MNSVGIVLPETPAGFCVQTDIITAGTSQGNWVLEEVARKGGRVVGVCPIGTTQVLVVSFMPLSDENETR